jgi:hypothetical protein
LKSQVVDRIQPAHQLRARLGVKNADSGMKRDDLKRQHLATCRAERDKLYAQLEEKRSGAAPGTRATGKTKSRLECEIAQLSYAIEKYEREPSDA